MNARSPYFLSTAGHMMALLALWIVSTLSPRIDLEVIPGVELVMPAPGGTARPSQEVTPPRSEVPPEPEPQPPAPPAEEEPETATTVPTPPQQERKRPAPEDVSDQEPTQAGLRPPSKDAIVPSRRGEEQQQPPPPPGPQQSDTPDAGPPTAEYRDGIGQGRVEGNALGKHADWYLARLHAKLASTWAPPAQGSTVGVQTATAHFVIQRDGRIVEVRIIESKANTRFERSVQRCILNASPLPPLPEELAASSIGVTVPFRKHY